MRGCCGEFSTGALFSMSWKVATGQLAKVAAANATLLYSTTLQTHQILPWSFHTLVYISLRQRRTCVFQRQNCKVGTSSSCLFAVSFKHHNQEDLDSEFLCKLCVSRLQARQWQRKHYLFYGTSIF